MLKQNLRPGDILALPANTTVRCPVDWYLGNAAVGFCSVGGTGTAPVFGEGRTA